MRHLILSLDFPPLQDGGVARSMDETARALAACGESVRVLTRGGGREVRRHDAAYPARVTRMPGHGWLRRHPLYLRLVLPFIGRAERGAVVHTSTWETAPRAIRIAPRYGWKVLVHAQGREIAQALESEDARSRLRDVLQAADAVLPISAYVRDCAVAAGADPARVHLIHPALDARRVQGGDGARFRGRFGLGDRPVLLTLARLIERKGQDTVIRALPQVLLTAPDLVYVIAGKGSYQPALEALARETGVAGHVRFAGFLPDEALPDAYAAADAYVMVSREGSEAGDIEGFGITYLEASAAGVPVVAGRSAGAVDAVEDGVGGLLVDPADPRAVAAAAAALLGDRARARAMGAAGKARVEREFSLEARARKIIRVAERLSGNAKDQTVQKYMC